MSEKPLRAMLLMTAFALAWVLVEEVIGATLSQPYPLLEVVWIRYGVHLVLMLLLNLSAPSLLWRTDRLGFHLARSLLMLVMPASYALALVAGLPNGSIWALFWISPLIALFGARLVLGDAVPPRTWATCVLCALAAGAMMIDRQTRLGWAVLLPVVMAVSFAGYVVMTRRLEGERLQTNLFYTALGVFVVLTPIVPWSWVAPNVHDLAELIGIGAVGLVALWALDRAVAAAPVSRSVPALYLHLPALVLVAWAMEGDTPSPRQWVGGLMIGAIVAWIAWAAWRRVDQAQGRALA